MKEKTKRIKNWQEQEKIFLRMSQKRDLRKIKRVIRKKN